MILRATVQAPCTLLTFLRRELGLSATLVGRLKWQNAFCVDGTPRHTNFPLAPGQIVTADLREDVTGYDPEPMPLDILYEDDCLIALDKPAGVLVHPSRSRNTGTLANGLLHYYRQTGQPSAVHPISRLDRDTVGVVLFAKSAHVHAQFYRLHQDRAIRKTYEAIVLGRPDPAAGVIDLPIRKCPDGSLLRQISPDGQTAVSAYETLETSAACTRVRLHPITGRTHQLRLHCLAAGFPILGDPQYCTPASLEYSRLHGLHTQQLCAAELAFPHPMTGQTVAIRSRRRLSLPTP